MNKSLIPPALILTAILWRAATATHPGIANVAPFAAIGFCSALYTRDRRHWLLAAAALLVSDAWLNHYFGFAMGPLEVGARMACFGLTLAIGSAAGLRRGWTSLAAGLVGSELAFYLITNTAAWQADVFYAKNLAGWWQAMTIGHPEYPPTVWFFRNSFIGDIGFAVIFIAAWRRSSARSAAPSGGRLHAGPAV